MCSQVPGAYTFSQRMTQGRAQKGVQNCKNEMHRINMIQYMCVQKLQPSPRHQPWYLAIILANRNPQDDNM